MLPVKWYRSKRHVSGLSVQLELLYNSEYLQCP